MKHVPIAAGFLVCLLVACAQGGPPPSFSDAGLDSGDSRPPTTTDSEPPKSCAVQMDCEDGLSCTGTDVCDADGECENTPHGGCDDGVPCTVDTCTEPAGDCTHVPADGSCPAGQTCDAALGCVDPPPCAADTDCDDGLSCNGSESCDPGFGCRSGTPVDCDDALTCTADACEEPLGTCTNAGVDGDGDTFVMAGCAAGDDCDDTNAAISPGAAESCNGVDDDCNGVIDDSAGLMCAMGSSPSACTTVCGTPGLQPCTATCTFGSCAAAVETCMNGCDDDADGSIDEGCAAPPPPHDVCAGAILLSGSGSRSADTLVGATADATDCGTGVEVFYRISAAQKSIVYLDTFGTGFDTRISYRGTACPGTTSQCIDDSCGTVQTQLAQVVGAGTHYFAIHTFSSVTTPGPLALNYQIVGAAGGDNTAITSSGTFSGSTSGASAVGATCGGGSASAEDAFYWMQCPGVARSVTATTCDPGTFYDTALHIHGASELNCNDDDFACFWDALQSTVTASTVGTGVFRVFVDGFSSSSSGSYRVSISGL